MPPAGTDGGSEDIRAIVADPDDAGAEQVRPAWFLTASVYGVRRKGSGSEAQLPPVAVQRRKKMVPESSSMFLALHHLLDYVRAATMPSLPTRAARSFRSSCKLMVLTLALADSS